MRREWGAELAATAADNVEHTTVTDGPGAEAGSVNLGVASGSDVTAEVAYGASGPRITLTNAGALVSGENPLLLTTRGGWMGRELW